MSVFIITIFNRQLKANLTMLKNKNKQINKQKFPKPRCTKKLKEWKRGYTLSFLTDDRKISLEKSINKIFVSLLLLDK